ncbi:MAG: hypothetical protein WDN04_12365 [Rhodospirillales bacterium]
MRPRHQDHARADGDQAQRRTQIVTNGQRADDAGQQRSAEWLQEDVGAVFCHVAAQHGAPGGTCEYDGGRGRMLHAEQHGQGDGARRGREREQPCRCRGRLRDCPDCRHCGGGREPAGGQILERARGGSDARHVHARGLGGDCGNQPGVSVLGLELQLSPARQEVGAQVQNAGQSTGRGQGLVGRLAIDVKNAGEGEDKVGTIG